MSTGRTAIVIGAGFGGMALAIRLQSAGIQTTLVEARDKPGGRAYVWRERGYVFDAGPTVITDPACLQELWALTGCEMSEDVELIPVHPFYRLMWNDGTVFDYSNDEAEFANEIERLDRADVAGYARFLDYARKVYDEGYLKLGAVPFLTVGSMIRAAPTLLRRRAWRSVYATVSSYVRNEKLRQALSFHALLVGGNPMKTSSIYTLIHALEKAGGVWFAKGGTNALVSGMVALFTRLGGQMILGDPVSVIEHTGKKVTGVTTNNGVILSADMIATNADLVHSYGLIKGSKVAARTQTRIKRRSFSPSLFVVYFGLRGKFPNIAHHSILFSDRYASLLDDIYNRGTIAPDPSLYLHHPTATDPAMAPSGHSAFYVLAPVPHLGKAKVDWSVEGPAYRERILNKIETMLIPDLRDRLDIVFHYTPADFQTDLGAHLGSAFSLEPLLTQSAWFRAHNRDDHFSNLYFVGAGTHPGAGIPGVIGSAKATASLMI